MLARIDPAVSEALKRTGRTRVIVTFDRPPTPEDLEGHDVALELRSIDSAALRVDRAAFERLTGNAHVVEISLDGEIRAYD